MAADKNVGKMSEHPLKIIVLKPKLKKTYKALVAWERK